MFRKISKSILALTLAFALSIGVFAPITKVEASKQIDGYTYTDEQVKVLDDINAVRKEMGLSQVTMDIDLTNAAMGHSKYLFTNDEIGHMQTKELNKTQESMKERIKAQAGEDFFRSKGWGSFSEVVDYRSPRFAVADLIQIPFHRDTIIHPDTTHIGVGTNGYHNTVINIAGKYTGDYLEKPLLYPYNGQKDVLLSMKVLENPDPFKGTGLKQGDSGFVLSVTVGEWVDKSKLKITLKDSTGRDINFTLRNVDISSDEAGFWAIIPHEVLKPSSKYTFTVNGSTSTFTTISQAGHDASTTGRESEYVLYSKLESQKADAEQEAKDAVKPVYNDLPKTYENRGNTASNAGINLDGKYLTLKPSARVINGVTYIPLRGVLESMGAKVVWDQAEQHITITKGKIGISMYVNVRFVDVYKREAIDKSVVLEKAPFVEKGVTFVPLRFISESLGAKVVWDQRTYTVGIDTGGI